MKTLCMTISLLMINFMTVQFDKQNQEEKFTVIVTFENVNLTKKGKIYLAVYNEEAKFMTSKMYAGEILEVEEGKDLSLNIKGLPEGEYAFSAFHDINGNQQMDFDQNGMPIEAWATSGNPSPYAPPTWQAVKIKVDKDQQISLRF